MAIDEYCDLCVNLEKMRNFLLSAPIRSVSRVIPLLKEVGYGRGGGGVDKSFLRICLFTKLLKNLLYLPLS